MLLHLQIRNLAVVRSLAVDFQPGMTAITGETGAGKSIALDALGLCLGDRADSAMIRADAELAEVIASFAVAPQSAAGQWLMAQEFSSADSDDDQCVLRRVITREGRSKAWINGYPVTVTQMRELAPLVVNIHGQHEHQLLTRSDHQLSLLDQYASHPQLLDQVSRDYQQWYQLRKQQKLLEQQQADRQARTQLLSYQLHELQEFALQADEFEQLEQQHRRLSNSAALREDASFALNALYEGEHNNAFGLVQSALHRLEQQLANDSALEPMVRLLHEAGVQLQEAASELRHYHDEVELDDEQLLHTEQRLSQAIKLARKHQLEPQQLPQLQQQLEQELAQLQQQTQQAEDSEQQVKTAAQQYRLSAEKLSVSRASAARSLSERISQAMQQLNMPHGQFSIEVGHQPQAPASKLGTDQLQFLVTTNPGQPLQALNKVASGGELSRISLAIQVITASQMTTPTLLFDEVDVGVSGATAATVGKLLRQLGQSCQVICVTHLPQVAAKAHHQLRVDKTTDGEHTETVMVELEHQQRVIELARLLGGDHVTAASTANAEELLAAG